MAVSLSSGATDYKEEVDFRINELLHIPYSSPSPQLPACLKRYENLYKDGYLNVTVGFGYWDSSPDDYVFDQYIANSLRMALVTPCTAGVNVCGFTRTGDTFRRNVPGPDGKNNIFTINLFHGTLTTSNNANTTLKRDEQYRKCQETTEKYFAEVSKGTEVVMYIGHARDGGGPDFCPPVRTADQHVNYPWYQANQPGFKKLLSSLDAAKAVGKENQLVGLYSCYSRRHFLNGMRARNPNAGYVLTEVEITSVHAIRSLVTTLDSLIGKKCSDGFTEGLNLSPGVRSIGMFRK